MNAVATKLRAKAKAKSVKSEMQTRLDAINSSLTQGRAKLEIAVQSIVATDLGEPVEVLLSFVTDNLLPEAIAPLRDTPLTRAHIEAAYTGMFPALAALQGVIALSEGSVIQSTVREAHDLLDAANSAMDFNDMGDALRQRSSSSPTARPPSEAELEAAAGWDDDEMHEVRCLLVEAIAIMRSRGEDANCSHLYGAVICADHAESVLSAGLDSKDARDCERASAPIGVACAVLNTTLMAFDDLALHGAWRLLDLAHSSLDAAVCKAVRGTTA